MSRNPLIIMALTLTSCLTALPLAAGQAACWQATVAPYSNLAGLHFLVHDSGTGPELFAAAGYVFRWDGFMWQQVGQPPAGTWSAWDIAFFDSGSGPELYAAGWHTGVQMWDGLNTWSLVGGGWSPFYFDVYDLEVHDDGSGPALYALGNFQIGTGPGAIKNIAKWDGNSWSAVGVPPFAYTNVTVSNVPGQQRLKSLDDGTRPALYVLGATGSQGSRTWKWDGSTWTDLVPQNFWGSNGTLALCDITVFDDGTGPALYMSGRFQMIGSTVVNSVARFNAATQDWEPLGQGLPGPAGWPFSGDACVNVLFPFDDRTGPALYAGRGTQDLGGWFGIPLMNHAVKKWDGVSWTPVTNVSTWPNPQPQAAVYDFAVFDSGSGPELFMGGAFTNVGGNQLAVGGISANGMARRACPVTPTLSLTQPAGPGGPVYLEHANLTIGREYYTVLSFAPAPSGLGTGLWGGLHAGTAANAGLMLQQILTPLGSPPTHFLARDPFTIFGPLNLPSLTAEAITFDFTGGVLGSLSPAVSLIVN